MCIRDRFETKQVFWLIGGLVAMFIFSLINYHRLLEAVHWVYGFCLVSLVAVLIVGTKVLGGRRWIKPVSYTHLDVYKRQFVALSA